MKYKKDFYSRSDKLTSELCFEIDDLAEQVKYWKQKYEERNKEYNELMNSSIKHSQQMLGNLLTATLKGCIQPVKNENI